MKFRLTGLLLILLLLGCNKDDSTAPEPIPKDDNDTNTPGNDDGFVNEKIEEEFKPYVISFLAEANARGKNPNNVIGEMLETLTLTYDHRLSDFCGYAVSWGDSPKVYIASSVQCWDMRSDIDREILIFHELGHAILERSHTNEKLSNGDWKSMMLSNRQFGLYQAGSKERTYYLDELFDPDTDEPSWVND